MAGAQAMTSQGQPWRAQAGAIAEAHKLGLAVADFVCVSRERLDTPFVVLTPCDIFQGRLAHWGGDVYARCVFVRGTYAAA